MTHSKKPSKNRASSSKIELVGLNSASLNDGATAQVIDIAVYKILCRHQRKSKESNAVGRKQARLWLAATCLLVLVSLTGAIYAAYLYFQPQITHLSLAAAVAGQQIANLPDGSTEATDESMVTDKQMADYHVANDEPRIIEIPSLNLKARVQHMGLNSDKTIQAPTNVNDAGWYSGSAKPGVIDGTKATFIDGHDIGRTGRGIFYKLKDIKKGDKITIEKGDGTKLVYRVKKTEVVALSDVDMNKAMTVVTAGKSGLNLMTCDGAVVQHDGKTTQSHRLIVYSELIK